MNFFTITVELVVGYIGLFVITKVLSKGTISQLTPFDFIAAILLGELVGSAVFDPDVKVRHLIYGLFIWFLLIYITEQITQRYKRTRRFLEGNPAIVIREGKIQRDALKRNKLDINQLQHLLRLQNAFSIREVDFAILETDGQLSVMKKPEFASPTKKDLQIQIQPAVLPVTLIIDGEVLWDNLTSINKDENWLEGQLKKKSISSIKDVFFADFKKNEGIFIDLYQ
ncbi:DUF421 domain-containing protein [Litchfieldia salsa]|uniref:Uncharacterized membrane protein YcaP, DUF421 family n=1 Tax=Litchfieldia salsa TaxID=930152 RepID=A0A1H0UR98_9BACI|nr:DUF421 domain-containing protein [Litchfieldia salsa]SDP68478.1 Uncharacterized membrane protein YcaP, DUF421 family [Litchfieldia salsa]